MGKSTISMAIFNSYVKLPEGIILVPKLEALLVLNMREVCHVNHDATDGSKEPGNDTRRAALWKIHAKPSIVDHVPTM